MENFGGRKLTRVSLSRAAFAELIPPPYLYQYLDHEYCQSKTMNKRMVRTFYGIINIPRNDPFRSNVCQRD